MHPVSSYRMDKVHILSFTLQQVCRQTQLHCRSVVRNSPQLNFPQDVRSGQWPVLSAYSDNAAIHSSGNVRRTTWPYCHPARSSIIS